MFADSEILGEFRIRGLQIGLYLRNISNENLGEFFQKFTRIRKRRKRARCMCLNSSS